MYLDSASPLSALDPSPGFQPTATRDGLGGETVPLDALRLGYEDRTSDGTASRVRTCGAGTWIPIGATGRTDDRRWLG